MRTVLVADHDHDTRAAVSTILHDKGYSAVQASDARRALTVLEDNPSIAFLIANVSLSASDDVTLIAQLRASARFRELPIIAVGSSTSVGDIFRRLELGASRFVSRAALHEGLADEIDAVAMS